MWYLIFLILEDFIFLYIRLFWFVYCGSSVVFFVSFDGLWIDIIEDFFFVVLIKFRSVVYFFVFRVVIKWFRVGIVVVF